VRVRFDFSLPEGKIILPVHYNHLVQAMIYKNISEQLADFLHSRGFVYHKRHFKLFTFSRLFGKFRLKKQGHHDSLMEFFSSLYFYVSSSFEEILREFAGRMVSGMAIRLGNQPLYLSSVQVMMPPLFESGMTTIKTLSPITLRSTLSGQDGTRKTYFYSPLDREFPRLIRENLVKKYIAFTGREPGDDGLDLRPLYFSPEKNFHPVRYKDAIIKGYSGIFQLSGGNELKQFAYDAGLGERNSQGFGMFDLWKQKE
jgi:CRISPR-associated endoribonuclease Cas6